VSKLDETPVLKWSESAHPGRDHELVAQRAFLLKLSDAMRPLSDPLGVQEIAVRLVGEYLQV